MILHQLDGHFIMQILFKLNKNAFLRGLVVQMEPLGERDIFSVTVGIEDNV